MPICPITDWSDSKFILQNMDTIHKKSKIGWSFADNPDDSDDKSTNYFQLEYDEFNIPWLVSNHMITPRYLIQILTYQTHLLNLIR